jgi:hypothetical protein
MKINRYIENFILKKLSLKDKMNLIFFFNWDIKFFLKLILNKKKIF